MNFLGNSVQGGGTALFEAALAVQEDAVKFLVAVGAPLGEGVDQVHHVARVQIFTVCA